MSSPVTFEDLLGLGLSPRSAYLYAKMLDRIVPLLTKRGVDLATCNAADLAAVAGHFTNSYSQRQALRSAFRAGFDVIGREDPPLRGLRVPPRPRTQCRALSEDAAGRLERAAFDLQDDDAGLAVLIGLYSGLRRAEIARLRWEHVLLDEHGRPEWLRVNGKGDVVRDVPVHPVLARVLDNRRRSAGWIFRGRFRGQPVSAATVWGWVKDVAAAAGLDNVSTHRLRHTALAEANDRSGNLRTVQEIAGHSRPETTAGYTRTTREQLRRVVSMIDYGRQVDDQDGAA